MVVMMNRNLQEHSSIMSEHVAGCHKQNARMLTLLTLGAGGIREAFKRKNRKYIGLLPILGGGVPPDQYISVFFLKKKHL